MNPSKIDIFIAYAREDKVFLDELRKQLRILKRNGTVNKIWYDGEIIAGQTWEAEIKQELENADIFLLLLSPDFLNSDYAYDIEMTKALERHRNGEATLIPIIARACAWHLTPLSELQAPVDGKTLGNLTPLQRDPLYSGIIDAVAKAAQQKRAEKEQNRRYFDDKKAWEKAVQLNTLKSYDNYLTQHPNGVSRSQAERAVREKQQAQASKVADKKAFQAAKAQNSIAGYQQYLKEFPKGGFRKEAWKGIQWLEDRNDVVVLPWKKIRMGAGGVLLLLLIAWMSGIFRNDEIGETESVSNTPIEEPTTVVEDNANTTTFPEPAMVFVKGDTFTMGCQDGRDENCSDDEIPAHKVILDDFYIGKYEVTVGEYLAFADATNSHYPEWLEKGNQYHVETGTNDAYKKRGYARSATNLPIAGGSWKDAIAYCKWLSQETGKNYRLPTEAEWEYAARGGQKGRNYQYAGSNTLGIVAWYGGNAVRKPHKVGGKKANELGIYDMSGNIREWCADHWHSDYNGAPKDGSAWVSGGSSSLRVLRGGSWAYSNTRDLRVANRGRYDSNVRYFIFGFRVAQD